MLMVFKGEGKSRSKMFETGIFWRRKKPFKYARLDHLQSCEMSNLLHRAKLSNQMLHADYRNAHICTNLFSSKHFTRQMS